MREEPAGLRAVGRVFRSRNALSMIEPLPRSSSESATGSARSVSCSSPWGGGNDQKGGYYQHVQLTALRLNVLRRPCDRARSDKVLAVFFMIACMGTSVAGGLFTNFTAYLGQFRFAGAGHA